MKKKRKSSTSKDDECTNSENIFEGNFDERWFRTLGSEVIKKLSEFKDLDQQESNLTVNEEILNDDMNEEAKSDSEDWSKEIRLKHQPESYNQNDNPFEVIESKVERNKKIATDSDSNQNVQDREFNMMETRPKVCFVRIKFLFYKIIHSFTWYLWKCIENSFERNCQYHFFWKE